MTSRDEEKATAREVFEQRVSVLEGTIRHQAQNKLKALKDLATADEALNARVMELVTYLKSQNNILRTEAEVKEDRLKAATIEVKQWKDHVKHSERANQALAERINQDQLAADKLERLTADWLATGDPLDTLGSYLRKHWRDDSKPQEPVEPSESPGEDTDATDSDYVAEPSSEPLTRRLLSDDAVAQFDIDEPEIEYAHATMDTEGKAHLTFRRGRPYDSEGFLYRIGQQIQGLGPGGRETYTVIDRSNAHGHTYLLRPEGGGKPFWADAEDIEAWIQQTEAKTIIPAQDIAAPRADSPPSKPIKTLAEAMEGWSLIPATGDLVKGLLGYESNPSLHNQAAASLLGPLAAAAQKFEVGDHVARRKAPDHDVRVYVVVETRSHLLDRQYRIRDIEGGLSTWHSHSDLFLVARKEDVQK